MPDNPELGERAARAAPEASEFTGSSSGPSGQVLAEISSSMVRLYREHFGKGPTKAKTYALDDIVICVLRDGITPVERTLFEEGRAPTVREMRSAFLDTVAADFTKVVERCTDRQVIAFLTQANANPDLSVQLFFLDGAVKHNGTDETDGDGI
jgi:uncharacterized protein YbcI